MRRLVLGTILCACTAIAADSVASTNGVPNPFWPIGYKGVRETISPNIRPKLKPAQAKAEVKAPLPRPVVSAAEKAAAEKAAAEKAAKEKAAAEKAAREKAEREAAARAEAERRKREITGAHWDAARAALKFGGRVKLREGDEHANSSVVVNGKVYADGDLISITHDSRRFTWRIEGLSDKNKLKLVRLRAKYLEKPGEADKKSDKGAKP